ncbi:LapD/MoxY N-terminal periplasmic domain-containing protein [Chromobacterium sp. IIBBL 290-4]|uniref:bifunctional diguanylate cyclase/phosphodiesterase n=1 Tax=Chromobacterium sp. IIBBL 290-4 TaxID=2953890 RepID=UPI0020B6393A|nr:LapD/MoxY N-terminal periplasmic domain-containing protein [Chromobacterium sp. IIBBL 290-4]UTH75986.1 EAL domain-containing protein [Chromobacterium sp. IIBBL 290-4]
MKNLSLIQRLWLLLLLLVFLSLSGALLANLYNARGYLEQQLTAQNANTANSLALMINQNRADPVMAETLINAAFDQGHLRSVRWQGMDGKAKVERVNAVGFQLAPQWFQSLLPLSPADGRALVTSGWMQAGEVQVKAELGYAYESLWLGTLQTMLWLLGAGLLAGLLGSVDIVKLRRDLKQVVRQANAISEHRFIQIAEPSVPELATVTRAMNKMVARLQSYLQGLSAELDQLRRERHTDAVTGLANREALEQAVASAQEENEDASGYLLLVRLSGLAELNQRLGGERADQLLRQLAVDLEQEARRRKSWLAARLRGADFALFCPELEQEDASQLAETLCQQLALYRQMGLSDQPAVGHIGLCGFGQADDFAALLTRASQALAQAEAAGDNQWRRDDSAAPALASERDWRELLQQSCSQHQLQLRWYPVKDAQRQVLRHEAMLYRPARDGQPAINALRLVSHGLRLGLTHLADLEALRLALDSAPSASIAVNLSPASLAEPAFAGRVKDMTRGSKLSITFEFDETGLEEQWDAFLAFGEAARAAGHAVAVETRGHRLQLVARLDQAGVAYLVLDGALTRGIDQDAGRQALVKGLQRMTALMGIQLVAKGVASESDARSLAGMGIDGLTGPVVG